MRILHVIDSMFVGGAETLVIGLSEMSRSRGNDVDVYALRSGGGLEDAARRAGVPLYMGGPGSVYSPLHTVRVARFIKSRKYDIIHVHLYPAQLWVCLAVRLSGCRTPVITTEHSAGNRREMLIFRWLDPWMYSKFAAIAAISEATRTALQTKIGADVPVRVVSNGIDSARFESSQARPLNPAASDLVILTIGSLTRMKDQATVIRALAKIEGVTLRLAGDGPSRAPFEALANELGVRSRVEFLGVRHDIPQLIEASDLYVQPSLREGFCLAVVEAMSGGLPCIAARNSGLQEVVGQAGLFFTPGDADELVQRIRELVSDPGKRAELSLRSANRARDFTLQACFEGYENLYRDTIRRFSARTGAAAA